MSKIYKFLQHALFFATLFGMIFSVAEEPKNSAAPDSPKFSDDRVILHTNLGDIAFAFYLDIAPKHAAQIRKLVSEGRYDGDIFYRLIPGFVAQVASLGNGSDIPKIPSEVSSIIHRRGLMSMARNPGDPNSADSSFSIMLNKAPQLDGQYTIFGEVVAGQEVLDAIEASPVDKDNKPESPIRIMHAEIVGAADFARMHLVGAHTDQQATSPVTEKIATESQKLSAGLFTGVLIIALAIILLYKKLSLRAIRSSVMLIILLSGFGLFAALASFAKESLENYSWAGSLAFIGSFFLFRFMGQFEPAASVEQRP